MKKLLLPLLVICALLLHGQATFTGYIMDGNDDVNENISEQPVFDNDYLKLGRTDDNLSLRIGLRYANVTIPRGSEIVSAHLQFTSFSSDEDSVTMRIFGEKSPDAAPFDNAESEIYNRPATDAAVHWDTQNWQDFVYGPDQRTPDLKEIIQEIIDQEGWRSGNALHIKMYKYSFGLSALYACAYEYMGDWYAPQLQVTYINWSDMEELPLPMRTSVQPNPVSGDFRITIDNRKAANYSISLVDLTGRAIRCIHSGKMPQGLSTYTLNTHDLDLGPGLYFLIIEGAEGMLSQKLMIR